MPNQKPKRWRKQASERGLTSVCQGPRGALLRLNGGEDVANVNSYGYHDQENIGKWWWSAMGEGIPRKNICREPLPALDAAKAAAEAYVRACLEEMSDGS